MKLNTKKIIAREFIALIFVLVLGILFYVGIFINNAFRSNQILTLKKEIVYKETLVDSLAFLYLKRVQNQEWYYNEMDKEFDLSQYNSSEKWWAHSVQLSNSDSLNKMWRGIWSYDTSILNFFKRLGFSNGESIQTFINKNNFNKIEFENRVYKIEKEINQLEVSQKNITSSIVPENMKVSFLIWFFIACISILFGVRYLYYGLKWSFKILNQQVE